MRAARATLTEAAAFLRERGLAPHYLAARDLEAFAHGEWSAAFGYRTDEGDRVVRFSASRDDFDKDRLATRFAAPALPIPRVLEVGPAGDPMGGWYAISERAYGGHLDDLDADGMRAMLPSLFAALDAMREADLHGTNGYGCWDARGQAPHATWRNRLLAVDTHRPRLPGWRERLEAEPARERFFRETYDRLRALVEQMPEVRHLVYSDLLHYNVLVDGDRITAIIDWGSALFGDFVYDVAWLAFWAPWYPAWTGIDFAEEAARHYAAIGLEVPAYEVRLRGCQLHIGQDALAYQAFTGRWDQFDWTAERLRSLAAGD